ncbi:alpha/beta hydrolase family protein [Pontibacter sp. MBLB2868]|uniref:alpha/beta hydrolase family protein n=1 Tax=Pontibacter sp. MBLB2868 TaxID=3451555 RepID=UPI003F754B82
MNKATLLLFLILMVVCKSFAQDQKPEDFGYRHLQMNYKQDPVDILVMSRKGDEQTVKPVLLFDQGSQARPLILLNDDGKPFMLFPFKADSLLQGYHLVIISKPYVPLIAYRRDLKHGAYADPKTGIPSAQFYSRDNVDYYVSRAQEVIKYLKKQQWVQKDKLVMAGPSAGSTVAAKLALECKDVTHLIYSGGNPFGRMASMISQAREQEDSTGTSSEEAFRYWETIVDDPTSVASQGGDAYRTTYTFSQPPMGYLMKLKIPVLVTYGTKDHGVTFNDYLRLETIRKGKNNFTFKPYIGVEHNYFGFDKEGNVDYDKFGWDQVAQDWQAWLGGKEVRSLTEAIK